MSNDDNAGIFNNDKIPERKSEISQEGSKVEVEEKVLKKEELVEEVLKNEMEKIESKIDEEIIQNENEEKHSPQ